MPLAQAYHVHFATIIDVLGKHCELLSNKSSLRVMEWVANYMVSGGGEGRGGEGLAADD